MACSDAWRDRGGAPPETGLPAASPAGDLAGHDAADRGLAAAGDRGAGPESGMDEAMEPVDHPLVSGRLTGAAADLALADFLRDWALAHGREKDTGRVYEAYVEDLGVARIAAHFEAQEGGCHGELHNLGKVVAERTADVATALAVCGDSCTYACIHGAVKAHYADRARDGGDDGVERARADLVAMCTGPPLIAGFYRGNCAHAAGHAFALMAAGAPGALALCASFPDREYAYYCATGVFMQLAPGVRRDLDDRAGTDRAGRAAARLDYCRGTTRFLGACMRFLLRELSEPDDLARIAAACDALAGDQRLGCFNALGYLGRPRAAREPAWLADLCGRGTTEDRVLCVSGFALAKLGNALRPDIDRACRALADADLSSRCMEQQGRHYYALGNSVLMRML